MRKLFLLFLVLSAATPIIYQASAQEDALIDCQYIKRGPRKIGSSTSYTKILKNVRGLTQVIPYVDDLEQQGHQGEYSFDIDEVKIYGSVREGFISFFAIHHNDSEVTVYDVTGDTFKILTLTLGKLRVQIEARCRLKK